MSRTARIVGAGLAAALTVRCASPQGQSEVRVTRDRAAVKGCVDLAQVKSGLDEEGAAEQDLKRQTADLGGNVLLVYNAHAGGAFYCSGPPRPEVTITGPGPDMRPTPPRQP